MDGESRQLLEDCFLRPIVNARSTNEPRPLDSVKAPVKSELQVVRLSEGSKAEIMDTLRFIRGQTFQLSQKSKYKEMGTRLTKGYWEERGNLVVQSVTDVRRIEKSGCAVTDRSKILNLSKLESFGFDINHCVEALEHCNGDSDAALELLYKQYFPSIFNNQNKPLPEISENEAIEMRADEMDALKSIYESDVIEEKEPNKVWLLKFKVDHLLIYSESEQKKRALMEQEEAKKKRYGAGAAKKIEKCKNFAVNGKCKYGNRCRFSHEIEANKTSADPNLDTNWFFLEFRFPKGNLYPYETPLIAVKTICPDISKVLCLRITRRCLEEAQILATDGMPSVYTIGDLLQNEQDIMDFLKNDRYIFPDPKKSVFSVEDEMENEVEEIKERPSHYKKGSTGRSEFIQLNRNQMLRDDLSFCQLLSKRQTSGAYKEMMSSRRTLPAWQMSEKILNAIDSSQVIVISGETGCGKSTQTPQFILDNYFASLQTKSKDKNEPVNIVCTQPRRLSAIGVAERVAAERCEKIGNIVGYQIRLENKISKATRLTFCTTGILLRRLQGDPNLSTVTHIIIDEVHERSEESDFLLAILKDLLKRRKNLRVILMSATLNASLFSNYFRGAPNLDIPGRTFPVEQLFLEDILDRTGYVLEPDSQYCRRLNKSDEKQLVDELEYADVIASNSEPPKSIRDENLGLADMYARYKGFSRAVCKTLFLMEPMKINSELIEAILRYIVDVDVSKWPKEGSILIFLPGFAEIQQVHDTLNDSSVFSPRAGKYIIVPLHSTLTNEEQALVFRKAPHGKRKIVLSTNIAETSVTIDDCVFVIDCGQMKEKRFDPNRNMESLDLVWESRANAQQRKGRAGRVRPGISIHLFTSHRFYNHFLAQPIPEIKRVPLEQLLLRIKTLPNFSELRIEEVISNIMEPPSEEAVLSAIRRLEDVGAFDGKDNLTALGEILATLPVDVRIGKLMLFGAIFQSVDSVLTIAACLSYKSPFVSPFNKRNEADKRKKSFAICNSDHLTILKAYKKWLEVNNKSKYAGRAYADENYLSFKTLETIIEIKHQYLELLVSSGFVPTDLNSRRRNAQLRDNILELSGQNMNANGENFRLLSSLLCAALYPNVVKVFTPEKNFTMTAGGAVPRQPSASELKFKTSQDGYVNIHPSSINSEVGHYSSPFLVYQEKIKTSRIYIRDCTMIALLPLILFSGRNIRIQMHGGEFILIIDDWIIMQAESLEVAEMMKYLREELLSLLEEKIRDPCLNLLHHENGNRIIKTIINLISKD
ncbi:putative ATP-dependent RNA helicase DHX57 [Contarinia nasturtii]|uniref:putative ATP-dependent RNA helicase DHX57 n=1 Tax=Contarinia nasturtii TaxID=265458 RepID=UPI0012D4B544|nr:putative ATP-dependent RNA helicase DHX57 [Contarinia nasturtii]